MGLFSGGRVFWGLIIAILRYFDLEWPGNKISTTGPHTASRAGPISQTVCSGINIDLSW